MRVMIDTNILIDVFTKRKPWFDTSYAAVMKILKDKDSEGMFSASAVTDLYYLLKKSFRSGETAHDVIQSLFEFLVITDVSDEEIQAALNSSMPDFEDAVVDACALRNRADFILTRNIDDFQNSAVPAVTPDDFLGKMKF